MIIIENYGLDNLVSLNFQNINFTLKKFKITIIMIMKKKKCNKNNENKK